MFVNECVGHTPVLVRAVSELLAVVPGDTVVDATVGSGGHARLFADAIGPDGTLIAIDVDPQDLAIAERSRSESSARPGSRQSTCPIPTPRPCSWAMRM